MDLAKEASFWRKISITGFMGVVVYILFIVVGSILWTNYNHITQTISELTAYGAPSANTNLLFALTSGVLQVIFAYSLIINFKSWKINSSAVIGAIFLLSSEIASLISLCILRLDLLGSISTPQNIMHFVITGIMIMCSIGSSFFIGAGLGEIVVHRKIGHFILYCGIVITISGVLLPISLFNQLYITGLIQRINTFTLQTWIAVLSIYIFRKI